MATGLLAQVQDYLKPQVQTTLPDYATDASKADLSGMVGQTKGSVTWQPTNDSLVSGQLEKLLSKDSGYLSLARTKAAQTAASRGLLNSSIAAGAGEEAAIGAALPIAQQDATTFATALKSNADAANTFASADNTFARDSALTKYQGVLAQGAAQQSQDFQRQTALANAALQSAQLEQDKAKTDAANALQARSLNQADAKLAEEQRQFNATQGVDAQKLAQNQAQFEATQRSDLINRVQQTRQAALDARYKLEADPNMTAEAKAGAITAIAQQATADITEQIKLSGLTLPEAWPDWLNKLSPTVPVAPTAGINAGNTPSGGAGSSGGGYVPPVVPDYGPIYGDPQGGG